MSSFYQKLNGVFTGRLVAPLFDYFDINTCKKERLSRYGDRSIETLAPFAGLITLPTNPICFAERIYGKWSTNSLVATLI